MPTRGYIGIEQDGVITATYVHYDAYPTGVGQVLADHYTDPEKISALVALGDISVLAPELGECQDFDHPTSAGWCLFYGRDRGERGVGPNLYSSAAEFLVAANQYDAEYAYLFRDGAWVCYDSDDPGSWSPAVPLADAIKADAANLVKA